MNKCFNIMATTILLLSVESLQAESVSHQHGNRSHSHPLPEQGIQHNHTNGGESNYKKLLRNKYVQKNLTVNEKMQCVSIMREVNSSVVAEDYSNLILSSELFIAKCRDQEPIPFAQRVGFLSLAYYSLGDFEKSLDVANMCIKNVAYGDPNCHKWKSLSLLSMGKRAEGIKELNITEKLTKFEIKNEQGKLIIERDNIKYVTNELSRQQHIANIALYKATIDSYERLLVIINNTRKQIN